MYYPVKRIIDVVGAISLLILFSPIMLGVAIAIKLTSKGPILADIPERVGKDGKYFRPYKFRSMIVNAHQLLREDPKFAKVYRELNLGGSYKIKNDPRVTPVGRFIRKYSIDEMPQLVNVICGQMSIVGPRPYYKEELDTQQEAFPGTGKYVKQMLKAKPGITGFWQVSGRSSIKFDKRIKMDAAYARKKSLLFDIIIILKTPWAMVAAKGAH